MCRSYLLCSPFSLKVKITASNFLHKERRHGTIRGALAESFVIYNDFNRVDLVSQLMFKNSQKFQLTQQNLPVLSASAAECLVRK